MKISVAVCSYNGEKYIKEQLQSIIHQTRKVDEIILCDDNSTDDTVLIATDLLETSGISYKIVVNHPGLGVMNNFRKAFSLCTGDIIISSDQDDRWLEDKTSKIEKIFQNHTKISMVATNAYLIDADGVRNEKDLRETVGFDLREPSEFASLLLRQSSITGATMALRKSFIDKYLYESKYWLHDGWLALIASLKDELYFLDEHLIEYRIHGNNVCGVRKFNKLEDIKVTLLKPYYMQDLYMKKYQAYNEMYEQIKNNNWDVKKEHLAELEKCVWFWNERKDIKKQSFQDCWKNSSKFKKERYYKKYTNSPYSKNLDRYLWIVYKLTKRGE